MAIMTKAIFQYSDFREFCRWMREFCNVKIRIPGGPNSDHG